MKHGLSSGRLGPHSLRGRICIRKNPSDAANTPKHCGRVNTASIANLPMSLYGLQYPPGDFACPECLAALGRSDLAEQAAKYWRILIAEDVAKYGSDY